MSPRWQDLYPTLPGVMAIPQGWHFRAAKLPGPWQQDGAKSDGEG
jgi:hypothetical protein